MTYLRQPLRSPKERTEDSGEFDLAASVCLATNAPDPVCTREEAEARLKTSHDTALANRYPDIPMGKEGDIPTWSLPLIRGSSAKGRYVFIKQLEDASVKQSGVYHVTPIHGDDYLVSRIAPYSPGAGNSSEPRFVRPIHSVEVDAHEVTQAVRMYCDVSTFIKEGTLKADATKRRSMRR